MLIVHGVATLASRTICRLTSMTQCVIITQCVKTELSTHIYERSHTMILDPAINVAHKSALVYIGAIALTGDRVTQTFNQLAQRGAQVEKSTRERLRQVA